MPRQNPYTGILSLTAISSSFFSILSRSGASPPYFARLLPPVNTIPAGDNCLTIVIAISVIHGSGNGK